MIFFSGSILQVVVTHISKARHSHRLTFVFKIEEAGSYSIGVMCGSFVKTYLIERVIPLFGREVHFTGISVKGIAPNFNTGIMPLQNIWGTFEVNEGEAVETDARPFKLVAQFVNVKNPSGTPIVRNVTLRGLPNQFESLDVPGNELLKELFDGLAKPLVRKFSIVASVGGGDDVQWAPLCCVGFHSLGDVLTQEKIDFLSNLELGVLYPKGFEAPRPRIRLSEELVSVKRR